MGSIFARGNRLYMHYKTVAGKWKQRRSAFVVGQEKEAEKFLKNLEEGIDAAIKLGERDEGPLTVARYHAKWSAGRISNGVASAKDDDTRIKLHVLAVVVDKETGKTFGDLLVDEVRPRHARDVVDALVAKMRKGGLAPRSVRHAFFSTRTMFQHLVTIDERLAANPCVLPKGYLPAKQDKDPTWRPTAKFTHAEVERLISNERVPEDCRVVYATLFLTGARFGEMAALLVGDYDRTIEPLGKLTISKSYDFKHRRVKGTKTGRAREIPVHPTLAKLLAEWLLGGWERLMGRPPKADDLLFPSAKPELVHGLYRNPNEQRKFFYNLCDELEIRRRRIHDTRRTFISLARDDGAQRDVIKSLTHPLDGSDAHDSYTTFAWSRCCEEVAKLKITLRRPGHVIALPKAATANGEAEQLASGEPALAATSAPARFMTEGGSRRELEKFGATLGAADPVPNKKGPESRDLGPFEMERETGLEPATSTLARWHSTTELLPRVVTELLGTSRFISPSLLRCQASSCLSHHFSHHLHAASARRMPARSMTFARILRISAGETVE